MGFGLAFGFCLVTEAGGLDDARHNGSSGRDGRDGPGGGGRPIPPRPPEPIPAGATPRAALVRQAPPSIEARRVAAGRRSGADGGDAADELLVAGRTASSSGAVPAW